MDVRRIVVVGLVGSSCAFGRSYSDLPEFERFRLSRCSDAIALVRCPPEALDPRAPNYAYARSACLAPLEDRYARQRNEGVRVRWLVRHGCPLATIGVTVAPGPETSRE